MKYTISKDNLLAYINPKDLLELMEFKLSVIEIHGSYQDIHQLETEISNLRAKLNT